MGLKEFIEQKQKEKSAPRYNIHLIEYAYTNDGQFVAPFIFNSEGTKIKDIETDKIIEVAEGDVNQALSRLFSVDANQIQYLSLLDTINLFTYGTRIPGKIFSKVRSEICEDFYNRETVINYGSINYLTPNFYELKPLTKQIGTNLDIRHRQCIERDIMFDNAKENHIF